MLLALAVWGWFATLQLGPTVPPTELRYLGPKNAAQPPQDGIDGLVEAPAARATAILFTGGFAFGGTAAMTAALDAAPGVKTIALDSPGGRIGVAVGIARLIRSRHLATAVSRTCASACTVAYVSGQPRLASTSSRFLFHLGTGPILKEFMGQAAVMAEQPWFRRAGVSLSFANRALHAPNERPYHPQLDELVAAGFVQRVEPSLPDDRREAALLPVRPLLEAIAALEPETARVLVWEHKNRVAGGMDAPLSLDFMELWSGLVANRWLARSSDTAAVALVDAMIAIMDATGAVEATGCMRWQVGVTTQMAGFRAIPIELRKRLIQAEISVLQDARSHPNPVPTEREELAQADQAVRQAVRSAYGDRALIIAASPEHAFDDPAKSCAAEAAYLRGLRNRPEGGRLLRWALAAG